MIPSRAPQAQLRPFVRSAKVAEEHSRSGAFTLERAVVRSAPRGSPFGLRRRRRSATRRLRKRPQCLGRLEARQPACNNGQICPLFRSVSSAGYESASKRLRALVQADWSEIFFTGPLIFHS